MTPTDATRPADGPGPDSGHTETPDAREGLRGLLGDRYGAFATALLHSAERLAEVTAERDALAASVARVRAQVEEWEARVSFNEASLVHHPDNFWHGMATKGRECADEARRALDGSGS